MPQKAKKADLLKISANPQPQAGLIERSMKVLGQKGSWFIYDALNNEILCEGIRYPVYQANVDSILYYIPVRFKEHEAAVAFTEGRDGWCIARIQEGLNTLQISWASQLVYPRP